MQLLARTLSNIIVGYRDKRFMVCVPRSKISLKILNLFYHEGIIKGYSLDQNLRSLIVFLNYIEQKPVVLGFDILFSSSKKIYLNKKNFLKFFKKNGFFVLSTNKLGFILSNKLFIKNQTLDLFQGGEVLFKIYI